MEELRACPFCGADAVKGVVFDNIYFVECGSHDDFHNIWVTGYTEEDAVRRWNQRVLDESLEDDLK